LGEKGEDKQEGGGHARVQVEEKRPIGGQISGKNLQRNVGVHQKTREERRVKFVFRREFCEEGIVHIERKTHTVQK